MDKITGYLAGSQKANQVSRTPVSLTRPISATQASTLIGSLSIPVSRSAYATPHQPLLSWVLLIYLYIYICVNVYIYISISIFTYLSIYIYIHICMYTHTLTYRYKAGSRLFRHWGNSRADPFGVAEAPAELLTSARAS